MRSDWTSISFEEELSGEFGGDGRDGIVDGGKGQRGGGRGRGSQVGGGDAEGGGVHYLSGGDDGGAIDGGEDVETGGTRGDQVGNVELGGLDDGGDLIVERGDVVVEG